MTPDEFAALIEASRERVINCVVSKTGADLDDIADAFQEASASCWEKLKRNSNLVLTEAYLALRTRSRYTDAMRREPVKVGLDPQGSPEFGPDGPTTAQDKIAAATPGLAERVTPEDQLIAARVAGHIDAVVSRWSRRDALMWRLYHVDGLELGDIACKQAVPIGTVKQRMCELRERMRMALAYESPPERISRPARRALRGPIADMMRNGLLGRGRDPLWGWWMPDSKARAQIRDGAQKIRQYYRRAYE